MRLNIEASDNIVQTPNHDTLEMDQRALMDETHYFLLGSLLTIILVTAPLTLSTPIPALILTSVLALALMLVLAHLLDLHTLIAHLFTTISSLRAGKTRLALQLLDATTRLRTLTSEISTLRSVLKKGTRRPHRVDRVAQYLHIGEDMLRPASAADGVGGGVVVAQHKLHNQDTHMHREWDDRNSEKQKRRADSAIAYLDQFIEKSVGTEGTGLSDRSLELRAEGIKVRDFAIVASAEECGTSSAPSDSLHAQSKFDEGKMMMDAGGDMEAAKLEMELRQRVFGTLDLAFAACRQRGTFQMEERGRERTREARKGEDEANIGPEKMVRIIDGEVEKHINIAHKAAIKVFEEEAETQLETEDAEEYWRERVIC
ncbi:hypothetical protein P154DRAFT_156604 [Amniculicola lignicola CBS 123094]|uniref:Uncharacterized protein n=1 Tax=Amniculicola lignicola CBS 123094 TaxID=1392246 RepID=A0A6A5WP57_9PLEO|nr:hypothetical protein P154DRAFT_156604 [Amniculicola lignicola CBS 123094]